MTRIVSERRPPVGALLLVVLCFALAAPGEVSGQPRMSDRAIEQLAALAALKSGRSPAQRKTNAGLQLEIERRSGRLAGGPLESVRPSVVVNDDGTVFVDIKAEVTETLLSSIESAGGAVLSRHPRFNAVRAQLPLDQVETIAALPEVRVVAPIELAWTNKINTSQGDVAHLADQARAAFAVNGSGYQVGVLSDSVDALDSLQASGDLPPNCPQPTGPCVMVLPGQSGNPGSSEGTALMEIVTDLAPGSDLFYATAFGSQASFAQNILDLAAAGADVIVDDVSYFAEPAFQDGVIAQAVETVSAAGVAYFSSAGNSGNLNDGTSGVWEGDYLAGPTLGTVGDWESCHDFGGGSQSNRITGNSSIFNLKWSDPIGGSANDYDLFLFNAGLTAVVAAATNSQTGTQDPYEQIFSGANDVNKRLVVCRWSGADRFLHLNTNRGRLENGTDGQIAGHSAAASGFGVAAVWFASATGPGGTFAGGEPVESFSSDGPRRIFYDADGTPITPGNVSSTGGTLLAKPDLAAADGVATATPGFDPFFGTSAAAPHAAAIAALMQDRADGGLSVAQIRAAMTGTAIDIEAPGVDRDSGAGIVDALAAVGAVDEGTPAPVVTGFSPGSGPVGSTVSVFGSGFTGATDVVFGLYATAGQSASFTVVSDTEISATVPAGAADGHIQVTTPGGSDDSPDSFLVTGTTESNTRGGGRRPGTPSGRTPTGRR